MSDRPHGSPSEGYNPNDIRSREAVGRGRHTDRFADDHTTFPAIRRERLLSTSFDRHLVVTHRSVRYQRFRLIDRGPSGPRWPTIPSPSRCGAARFRASDPLSAELIDLPTSTADCGGWKCKMARARHLWPSWWALGTPRGKGRCVNCSIQGFTPRSSRYCCCCRTEPIGFVPIITLCGCGYLSLLSDRVFISIVLWLD